MPAQLNLAMRATAFDAERRGGERRAMRRPGRDRRRGERRRAAFRSIAITALTITAPHYLSLGTVPTSLVAPQLTASVTVVVNSYVAVPARRAYESHVRDAARRYRVDAALIRSIVQTESRYNAVAVSPAGALGLMQLMPSVLRQFGVTDPFDPHQNIMAGTRYLRQLLDLHHGDVRLALASYNAGPANVAKYGDVPPFAETHSYIERVTALLTGTR